MVYRLHWNNPWSAMWRDLNNSWLATCIESTHRPLKLNPVRYLPMGWTVWAGARIVIRHTTCYEFSFIQVNVTLVCRNASPVCMVLARITQYSVSYCYISFSRTSTRASFYIYVFQQFALTHYDVIKGKHFRVTGHLCREFTGDRWIACTQASDAELWLFLWSAPE